MVEPKMNEIISEKYEDDSATLCGSQHTFVVAYSSDGTAPKPIQDYIVVTFAAQDTSGGGLVEEWIGKIATGIIDGVTWVADNTVVAAGEGMADWSRSRGVVYGEGVEGGFAKGYKETVDSGVAWVKSLNPFGAEQVTSFDAKSPFYSPYHFNSEFRTDWFGTDFHPVQAASHRIRIKIFCTYEGNRKEVYDSELAGCTPLLTDDECLDCCDGITLDQFLINSPGTWEVQITPVATGSCESLEYNKTATFEVPEPEGWKPAPVEATLQTMSDQIEIATGARVPPAVVGIGCAVVGGLLLFRVYKKRKAKEE